MSPPAREVWIEINQGSSLPINRMMSPPAREVWIEILGILFELL